MVQDYFKTMQHAMDVLHSKIGICMGVSAHGNGIRGGSGKLQFNPTGLPRDGFEPWEVKVLPAESPKACISLALDLGSDNLSPSSRISVGKDGHISSLDGHQIIETMAWTNNQGGQNAGAYLMAVQGKTESLRLKASNGGATIEACRDETRGVTKVTSHFDMVSRTVIVPDDKALPLRFEYVQARTCWGCGVYSCNCLR